MKAEPAVRLLMIWDEYC